MAFNLMLMGAVTSQEYAFDFLESTVTASTVSNIEFLGIAAYSDYRDLQIRISAIPNSTAQGSIGMRFNSSTSGYSVTGMQTVGTTAQSFISRNQNSAQVAISGGTPGSSTAAAVINILDFSNNTRNTSISCISGGGNRVRTSFGGWHVTDAITSILILPNSNGFLAGTRVSIYGVK
jgi:hypothetical protein